mmetsp:Transcript_71031/g.124994  ORF Transcript_71031/g.124994 Transcript_71031/m.124994 type:complete len:159 (-) Transcript_71031:320-796(-)
MKPDYDKLGKAYADSEAVQIVDVDCTADGQQTCSKVGVKGYPTIKYFTSKTAKNGADYQGGRDFNSLKGFVEKTLNVLPCNPKTLANCAKNEKEFIEKNKDKSVEELTADLEGKTAELKALKKERGDAEAELAAKQKAWKKKETLLTKATKILQAMTK